jgi:class 3 adenylate cyclase
MASAPAVACRAVPLFMDRHDGVEITPEDVAIAHARDVEAQARYDVQYHTYWYDPEQGTVFCLMEGPSMEAVDAVHREAHAASASVIIELPEGMPLELIFGNVPTQAGDRATITPATRAIVFTDMCGSVAQTHQLGDDGHMSLLREHDRIVRYSLAMHHGREVKHTGDGMMASFTSVASAVAFAVDVQRDVQRRNEDASPALDVSIGISAGEPVTDHSDDLFGAAVQLAARLCSAASAGAILVSVAVRELCIGKSFDFRDNGRLELKGLPEPTQTYGVSWT